jgi:hypothetical protein
MKGQKGFTFIHILGIAVATIVLAIYIFAEKKPLEKPRSEQVQELFFADGSNYQLIQLVKKSMNDPDSFEHVETKYVDNGSGDVVIFMKFRGNNAFGAKVLTEAVANIDPETEMITNLVTR